MTTVIIFIIVLAVLIFVHELGHFLLARWNGIRVDEFALGFGPNLFCWKRGETTYGLNLIPFGGYVKIFGETPDAESITGPDYKRSFVNKNRWQQTAVLAAGVFFNFVFAFILYALLFLTGVTATKDAFIEYADRYENERIMITYVSPDSPAEQAGIKMGDVIVPKEEAKTIESIQNSINSSNGQPMNVSILRDGRIQEISVIPKSGIVDDKYAIGIAMSEVVDVTLPVHMAVINGLTYTGGMIKETAVGLFGFLANIFKGQANFADVAGPIGIAGIVGDAADMGLSNLLMITALISINLGVINLLPFPALDGGRILFVAIEGIVRRRIPSSFANTVNAIGFILLMGLMIAVTYKDIVKLLT